MPSRLYKILLFLGIIAVLVSVPIFYFHESSAAQTKRLEVNFLDVGQGDAVLIKTSYDQNILIDGGPDDSVIEELGENLAWWDRQIDLMILTHPHDDHVTGLIDVIKRYQVSEIIYTGVVHTSPNFLEWLNLVKEKNIPVKLIEKPQRINLGEDCYMDIVYPIESFFKKEVSNLNNTSIVIKLTYKENVFLFTGDMEKEVEDELLLQNGVQLNVDVLKVAHYGSDTSSSEEFLNILTSPRLYPSQREGKLISVISVGEGNDFGHPSLRILKRLERIDSEIYRTDINGTIRVRSDGASLEVASDK